MNKEEAEKAAETLGLSPQDVCIRVPCSPRDVWELVIVGAGFTLLLKDPRVIPAAAAFLKWSFAQALLPTDRKEEPWRRG
jgi:hypothetical protein